MSSQFRILANSATKHELAASLETDMDSNRYYLRFRGKIRGPYAVDQLRRMASRGEFSKMHQVSIDQREWQPATFLHSVFEPSMPTSQIQATSVPKQQASELQWYYAVGDQRLGPVSRDVLLQMIVNRQLTKGTLVWQKDMPDWLPAELVFAGVIPATRGFRVSTPAIAWTALALVLAIGGVTGSIVWWNSSKSRQLAATIPATSNPANATNAGSTPAANAPVTPVVAANTLHGEIVSADVSSPAISAQANEAVGMVVCYLEINMKDGVHHELWFGHGTCFIVNSSGNAITNRHVINDHKEWMNATPEGRIKKLLTIFLEAFHLSLKKDKTLAMGLKAIFSEIATITPHCITYFGNKGYPTTIHYISSKYDLAVLRIEGLIDPPWFGLSSENVVPKLTPVIAMGFPGVSQAAITETEEALLKMKSGTSLGEKLFGTSDHRDSKKASAFEMTPTPGDISVVQQESGGIYNAQSTAPIRPGNSGGPLVFRNESRRGAVYAINTLYLKDDAPVFISFPIAQMKAELEVEAKVPSLKWR